MTMDAAGTLARPLTLPNGHTVPNRIVKAAMSEVLAEPGGVPGERLFRLYEEWGRGGTGVLLTGNVAFDRRGRTEPDNVVLDAESDLAPFREWTERVHATGAQLWMQINHSGRQASRKVTSRPLAPSPVPLQGMGPFFKTPEALSDLQIRELIDGWAMTVWRAKQAGFDGAQIHAAHGYLNSQFLSPLTNRRDDQWGGTPEKRRRFLLEIVRRARELVGEEYPISVKLNSADFQRGGFDEDESMAVVAALEAEGIDLLEISGGNYESPTMTGLTDRNGELRESTAAREAYFIDYAEKVRERTSLPLLLTGGLRSADAMASVIGDGHVDLVGMARPLTVEPDLPNRLMRGEADRAAGSRPSIGHRRADSLLQIFWYQRQMHAMADGRAPDPKLDVWSTLAVALWHNSPFHRSPNRPVRPGCRTHKLKARTA